MTGYALHPEARFDLDEIWESIRANNVHAANRVIEEILSAIRGAVPFPYQGHRRTDLTERPLRFISVRDYLIAYAPDEKPLVGDCRHARPPQPGRNGRDSPRPRRPPLILLLRYPTTAASAMLG